MYCFYIVGVSKFLLSQIKLQTLQIKKLKFKFFVIKHHINWQINFLSDEMWKPLTNEAVGDCQIRVI